jgi:hypothetical protein
MFVCGSHEAVLISSDHMLGKLKTLLCNVKSGGCCTGSNGLFLFFKDYVYFTNTNDHR